MPPYSGGWLGAHSSICRTICRFSSMTGSICRKLFVRNSGSRGMSSRPTNSFIIPTTACIFSDTVKSMIPSLFDDG